MGTTTRFVLFILVIVGACNARAQSDRPPILLFSGEGTSPGDVDAVERILDANHLAYATATSRRLNGMTQSQVMAYRMMIVPGGNFIDMSASLTPRTTAMIHDAVRAGMNYLGICAGAFLAGDG